MSRSCERAAGLGGKHRVCAKIRSHISTLQKRVNWKPLLFGLPLEQGKQPLLPKGMGFRTVSGFRSHAQ